MLDDAHHQAPYDRRPRQGRPVAIANSAYKRQKRNPGVTEIKQLPNRGHSLTIDHGWQEVAQTALDFVNRFAPTTPSWSRS